MRIKLLTTSFITSFVGAISLPLIATAATPAFQLDPFAFVGTAAQCAPSPAGTDTITAKWDNTTGNPGPSILLQKIGPTADCSAAGVDIISSLEGGPLSALTELNFDYKDGGHCGGGSPRFNVETSQGTAFLGCTGGTQTAAGSGWTHVEFTAAQLTAAYAAAGITSPATATLTDVYIIFDEGTDVAGGTPGSVNIDNISVNNQVVGSPTSPLAKDDCKKDGWKAFGIFKNQGDCVSFVATAGHNQPANKPTF